MANVGGVRIGISGWDYASWRGIFYPDGLARAHELEFAAQRFRSIEANSTFYGTQTPKSFARWAEATPDDFVFSIKAPRYITHVLRLKEASTPLANFLASGLLRLGAKLGPILWQLPPQFRFSRERIEAFLKLLPHDTATAARIARRNDFAAKDRVWIGKVDDRPMRHAIEIRHDSFVVPDFVDLLRRYDVALVCADTVEWPRLMDVTSDFMYCRLHGSEVLYASGYDDAALETWARRVAAWAQGREPRDAERIGGPGPRRARDVFVYFDNDAEARAPFDAQSLVSKASRRLGRGTEPHAMAVSPCRRS
jgi:uncharacterized protein YecE (DUF72 family)